MNKKSKIWLVVAGLCVLCGAMLFVFAMSKINWDFKKLDAQQFETNNYEIVENFENILIQSDTTDIVFEKAIDGKCRVECFEYKKEKHNVLVENGVLKIGVNKAEKKWYDFINRSFNEPKIVLYLPESEGISLEIKNSTGDIEIKKGFTFENISVECSTGDVKCSASSLKQTKIYVSTGDVLIEGASSESYDILTTTGDVRLNSVSCTGEMKIEVSTGDNVLNDVKCQKLISRGSTGDINLINVVAIEKISIERDTGDVEFAMCDALELSIITSTGDVEGTLLTHKIFIVRTSTGDVDVPSSITGGRCEITTETGDIDIRVIAQ